MKKIWKRIIWIFFFIIIFLLLTLLLMNQTFFKEKIYSAHLSYINNCIPESKKAIESVGFTIGGTTMQIINQTTKEKEIFINVFVPSEFSEERLKIMKHELCHSRQFQSNRIFPCITYIPHLTNEIECYIAQDLPNDKFEEKYGKINLS